MIDYTIPDLGGGRSNSGSSHYNPIGSLSKYSGLLGGISSISDIQNDPLGAITSVVSSFPVVGGVASFVGGLGKAFGIGPEDWTSVENRFKQYAYTLVAHFDDMISQAKTLDDFNNIGRYIEAARHEYMYNSYHVFESSNSKKGTRLVGEILTAYQKAFREKMNAIANRELVTLDLRPYKYIDVAQDYPMFRSSSNKLYQYTSFKPSANSLFTNQKPKLDLSRFDVSQPDIVPVLDAPYSETKSSNPFYVVLGVFGALVTGVIYYLKNKK